MPSLFVGVYTTIYDYTAAGDQELTVQEGDTLCVIERPEDDDWWKAKKKGNSLDEEEPVGLVPSNYIEEAKPIGKYKALYDYTSQTEEEVSFTEDAILNVYDVSDPDWALVGIEGQYGFAPANYIEKLEDFSAEKDEPGQSPKSISAQLPSALVEERRVPTQERGQSPDHKHESPQPQPGRVALPPRSVAVAGHRSPPSSVVSPASPAFPKDYVRDHNRTAKGPKSQSVKSTPKLGSGAYSDSESDGPGLPMRRPGQPRYGASSDPSSPPIPPGFRQYPVQEVDGRKKRAAILGVGSAAIILLPDKSTRPKEEWSVDDLKGYNHEGKHVFLEFEKPERSLDLHAGSTERAEEIVSAIGEVRGVRKAAGLEEVIRAATGPKADSIGTVLYDFPAQGDDEVSVTVGDEVIILDDTNSEWWLVRRQVNGYEGVVPSSYVEKGRKQIQPRVGIIESPGVARVRHPSASKSPEIGPSGVPERRSSLAPRPKQSSSGAPSRPKPDPSQVRIWTDRTNAFKVDAQFLALRDGKIHLHKTNGVKIAVPVSKMSIQDIKYVEDREGVSLDEDKPLSEIMKQQRVKRGQSQAGIVIDRSVNSAPQQQPSSRAPPTSKKSDYDWYKFFLECGVDFSDCERYSINFQRDNMDESVLQDITPEVMRTLGMKEGDIIRVRKRIEQKYGGQPVASGLFSENGVLKGSRSRPPPSIQTGAAVDPHAFKQQRSEKPTSSQAPSPVSRSPPAPITSASAATPALAAKQDLGFEDEAWAPKPIPNQASAQPQSQPQLQSKSPAEELPKSVPPQQPPFVGALQDIATLSLSTPPLQPTIKSPPPVVPAPPPTSSTQPRPTPLAQPVPSLGLQTSQVPDPSPPQQPVLQPTGISTSYAPPQSSLPAPLGVMAGRTRPSPPAPMNTGNLGIPPPPTRPLSAPQAIAPNQMPSQVPVLTPNYTGHPNLPASGAYPMAPLASQPPSGFQIGQTPLQVNPTGYQSQQFTSPVPFSTPLQPSNIYQTTIPQMSAPTVMQASSQGVQSQPQLSTFASFNNGLGASSNLGINSRLPPALIPQPTGQSQPLQVLKPTPTGPPPPVKFGVQSHKKLISQPTGRADLSKASPYP